MNLTEKQLQCLCQIAEAAGREIMDVYANDHVLQTPKMMKENNGAARGCQRSIFFWEL
jgi:hypothetical protein